MVKTRNLHHADEYLHRYILLDRDGVINRRIDGGYVTSWPQFEFMPRALDALRLLNENRYTALVISNQAAVSKGLMTSDELDSITRKFLAEVTLAGGEITQVYYCRHREEDRCTCRKPLPGLIVRAKVEHGFQPTETFFIGDSVSDLAAAHTAGCPSILIRSGANLALDSISREQAVLATDLYEAAEMVLSLQESRIPVLR